MALYSTPERHAANPPSTWRVVKAGPRLWNLVDQNDDVISSHRTKREAEEDKVSGPAVSLYEKEGRWYRGETVVGWKPYVPKPAN